MAAEGDFSVNLWEHQVFGGVFWCGPMQYYCVERAHFQSHIRTHVSTVFILIERQI